MSNRPTVSLRFGHPDGADRRAGLSIDLRGRLATVSGSDAIRQSLLLLISTRPGERVMRPDYGCPLHRLMFQPVDATTAGLAIHYVEQAVRRWEPRVEIIDVDAGPGPEQPTELVIRLGYRVRASQAAETLEFALDLAGATP